MDWSKRWVVAHLLVAAASLMNQVMRFLDLTLVHQEGLTKKERRWIQGRRATAGDLMRDLGAMQVRLQKSCGKHGRD